MSPLMYPCARRERQRGAIGLLAALTMALALLCTLVVVDSGRLYMEKRSLQRVADMAALEAASLNGNCTGSGSASGYAIQSATRNGFTVTDATRTLTTLCGTLATGANNRRVFTVDATQSDAIQVTVTHSVPRSIAAGIGAMFDTNPSPANISLTAVAVATPPLPPLAQLTISSTLATIDSSRGALLNALWGGLLGGTLNISAVGYQGLADANINLLKFLDQLALDVNAKAGDYTSLLGSNIAVSQILNSSLKVLPQSSAAAQAAINSLNVLVGNTTVKLQDLIDLQTGAPAAALNTSLTLFNLAQGLVQAANSNNALAANLNLNLGVASVTAKVKVVEPAQLSAIGDPSKNPQSIQVRTAQVRTMLSVDLSPLSNGLKNTLSLLGPLLSITVAPSLDVSIEISPAATHVTGYSCASDATKSLSVVTTTSAAVVKAGTINTAAWASSTTPVTVAPAQLATLSLLGLTGGLGLSIDTPVGQTTQTAVYPVPNEIGAAPGPVMSFSAQNLVGSLQNSNISVSLTGPILSSVGALLNGILSGVTALIPPLLSPLLDPLLNQLLSLLGINVANVSVGANLSCHPGQAQLVI
jgi:uncharacterized membrane protein